MVRTRVGVPRRPLVRHSGATKATLMLIHPMGDRLLVRRDKGKEQTNGGIIIPEAAREQTGQGEVVQVGPGRVRPTISYVDVGDMAPEDALKAIVAARAEFRSVELVPPTVKVGDRVLFSAYAGTPLELEETVPGSDPDGPPRRSRVQYVLLREEDVLAVVQGEGVIELNPAPPSRD